MLKENSEITFMEHNTIYEIGPVRCRKASKKIFLEVFAASENSGKTFCIQIYLLFTQYYAVIIYSVCHTTKV